jgi:poly(hydroxyalkanoate) granule-associated protein
MVMTARTANAYEQQLTQVFGKVKGAYRGAWLAGLGAVARVQTQAPRYVAGLVKEGERFEGRALKSAEQVIATIKESRGYEKVRKAARPYVGRLQKAYGETAIAVRKTLKGNGVAKAVATAKRDVKRTAKSSVRRAKRVRAA